jgi:isocitrate/isopropylmalate dehydrogenase
MGSAAKSCRRSGVSSNGPWLRIDLRERLFGLSAWKAHGTLMPDETWGEILATDAILFRAIGSHEYPRHCLCFLAYMLDRRDDGCRNKGT